MPMIKLWNDFSLHVGLPLAQSFHLGLCSSSWSELWILLWTVVHWRERRKADIFSLLMFFRRSLRSFYINCNDNKTLTYSRSCGVTGFAISDLTIFQWYIQTSVTHINFIILPKHCYWGWRGSLSY